MKPYLLIIMDDEPAIVDTIWCDNIEQAKGKSDDLIAKYDAEYMTQTWLGQDDYPYRKAIISEDGINGRVFAIEIIPSKKMQE